MLPAQLSGGMKKRVSLARALVTDPEIVLFDEPTTGLDPIMVQTVDELIERTARERGLTSVIVTHDLASIRRLADRVAFIHDCKIILHGPRDDLFSSELAPIRAFLDGARPIAAGAGRARDPDAPLVELAGVHKQFGDKHVLRGVDLAVYPRRTTVLIGASGSGKSVIIKHVMGLLKPDAGEIRVFGQDILRMSDRELARVRTQFGLVFQHAALLDWLSVEDNIAFPLVERRAASAAEIRDRVGGVLERLRITELRRRMPAEISLGQRKRVGLARAIVTRPRVMIYDEPTTGQDPQRTREIDDMILETQAQLDVASHDMESTFRIADAIAILHDGIIVARGTPDEIRASPDGYVQRFIGAACTAPPSLRICA